MHPRERVLNLAILLRSKGQEYPKPLLDEAKRLDIKLPETPKPNQVEKETEHGSD